MKAQMKAKMKAMKAQAPAPSSRLQRYDLINRIANLLFLRVRLHLRLYGAFICAFFQKMFNGERNIFFTLYVLQNLKNGPPAPLTWGFSPFRGMLPGGSGRKAHPEAQSFEK